MEFLYSRHFRISEKSRKNVELSLGKFNRNFKEIKKIG